MLCVPLMWISRSFFFFNFWKLWNGKSYHFYYLFLSFVVGLFLRDFYYLYVGSSLHVFDVCHFLIKLFILLFLFGFRKSVFSVTVPLKYLFLQLLFALILNYFLGSVTSFFSFS